MSSREDWIDVARGIGISLVIVGHIIISSRDAGQVPSHGFWADAVFTIYTFHMPLFMILSGLFISKRIEKGLVRFVYYDLITIIWPYIFWGGIALLAEWIFAGVRNPIDTSRVDITLLWTPIAWLWFLWALAIYHVITLILFKIPSVLVSIACLAWACDSTLPFLPFPHQLAHFSIFYVCGFMVGRSVLRPRIATAYGFLAALLFPLLVWLAYTISEDAWSFYATGAAITGSIATIGLAQKLSYNRLLMYLGRRSMPLYISHIFFNTATRIILSHILLISNLVVIFTLGFICSFLGPIILLNIAEKFRLVQLTGFGRPYLFRSTN